MFSRNAKRRPAPYLGDIVGLDPEPMRLVYRPKRYGDRVEAWTHVILASVAGFIFVGLMATFIVLASIFATTKPALSADIQYPVSVPAECVELAQRERMSLIIESRTQGLRAKAKLYRLSGNDPLVKLCRDAVKRIEAEVKQ